MAGLILADQIDQQAGANDAVSWSRRGYEMRRPTWDDSDMGEVRDKTVVVTGSTAGIGLAVARSLVDLNARVVLVSRSADLLAAASAELAPGARHAPTWVQCDIGSMASVRTAATQLIDRHDSIDVLVNNVGTLLHARQESADGHDLMWAVNVLGPLLLTELLFERLRSGQPGRVVEVSSESAYRTGSAGTTPVTTPADYDDGSVYARTKRAQLELMAERATRWNPDEVICHSMHPGWVATPGVESAIPQFAARYRDSLRTPAQGGDTAVWLASASTPASTNGRFWHDRREREIYRPGAGPASDQDRRELIRALHTAAGTGLA